MFRTDIMKDSTTYQFIIHRGRLAGARHTVFRLGSIKFGQLADAATRSQIESIADLDRLDAIADRVLLVSSWADLLAEV
jgi:hypothetical protein